MGDLNLISSKPVHIVALPYPAQGHTVPLMRFCTQLASLGGFTITFVNTEHIHARMLQAASYSLEEGGGPAQRGNSSSHPNIRLVSIPGGLPPELHGEPEHVVAALQASEALSTPFDNLLHQLNLQGPPVTHILSDAMTSWTQSSADKFGIPRLAFWTSSATCFYVVWHMFNLVLLNNLPSFKAALQEDINKTENMVSWIPGLPPVDVNELPAILQSDPTDFVYQFMMRQLQPLQRAACILINTVYELEEQILSALQPTAITPPIFAIGPLLPPCLLDVIGMTNCKPISKPSYQNGKLSVDVGEGFKLPKTHGPDMLTHATSVVEMTACEPFSIQLNQNGKLSAHASDILGANGITSHTYAGQGMGSAKFGVNKIGPCIGGSIFGEDTGCLQWLDDQSPGSVLYISFGSLYRMGEEQFKELAAGVEASGEAFLWSIRPDFVEGGNYADKLPPSFLERTKERGMMLPWVPQLEVLSHPSIGGFLTHCGWNSMLESVCMGVPIMCWPDAGERRTNGLLAIRLWHTGLDFTLPKGTLSDHLISRYEVERMIKLLMGGQSPIRSNAAALRNTALHSLHQSHSFHLLLTHMTHHTNGPFKFDIEN